MVKQNKKNNKNQNPQICNCAKDPEWKKPVSILELQHPGSSPQRQAWLTVSSVLAASPHTQLVAHFIDPALDLAFVTYLPAFLITASAIVQLHCEVFKDLLLDSESVKPKMAF